MDNGKELVEMLCASYETPEEEGGGEQCTRSGDDTPCTYDFSALP